jgi:hypothetical protein
LRIKVAILLVSVAGTPGMAHAETGCEALLTKISKGFQAAHQMSPADRTAKCRAYAMVTLDADDIAQRCRAAGDMALIETRYMPVAKALGSDEETYCGGH